MGRAVDPVRWWCGFRSLALEMESVIMLGTQLALAAASGSRSEMESVIMLGTQLALATA